MAKKFTTDKHSLIPKHVKLNDKEKQALLERYNISLKQLPKILVTDPALANLNVKSGDVIKIVRQSPTAGESIFYRGVINA